MEKGIGELRVRIGCSSSEVLANGIGDFELRVRRGAGIGTFCGFKGAGYGRGRGLSLWFREWPFWVGVGVRWL